MLTISSHPARADDHPAETESHYVQNTTYKCCYVSLAGAATSIIKHVFCRDKSMLAATNRLSRQSRFCPIKFFVATSMLLSREKTYFVATNTCLSRQNVCHDKNDTCAAPGNDSYAQHDYVWNVIIPSALISSLHSSIHPPPSHLLVVGFNLHIF